MDTIFERNNARHKAPSSDIRQLNMYVNKSTHPDLFCFRYLFQYFCPLPGGCWSNTTSICPNLPGISRNLSYLLGAQVVWGHYTLPAQCSHQTPKRAYFSPEPVKKSSFPCESKKLRACCWFFFNLLRRILDENVWRFWTSNKKTYQMHKNSLKTNSLHLYENPSHKGKGYIVFQPSIQRCAWKPRG